MSVITYDDRDPIFQYSGGWVRGGNPPDLNGTSTFTDTSSGTTATITFNGVQISVFGTIPITTPKSTSAYSIDGGAPTLFTAAFSSANVPNGFFYRQHFFTSSNLAPNVPHTLVISQTTNTNTRFVLDYIEVVGNPPPVTTSSASPTPTPAPTPTSTSNSTSSTTTSSGQRSSSGTTALLPTTSSTSSTFTSSSTVFTTSNASSPILSTPSLNPTSADSVQSAAAETTTLPAVASTSSKSSIGLIVGVVIGVLAIVVLFLLCFLVWKKRRQRKRPVISPPMAQVGVMEVRPFYDDVQSEPPFSSAVSQSTTRSPTGKSLFSTAAQYSDAASTNGSDARYSHYTIYPPPPQYES